MKRVRWWMMGLVVLAACGGAPRTPTAVPGPSEDTTLGVGDVFEVHVYGEQDLSGSYRVAQSGTVDYPLIGRIQVEGLEPPQLADLIQTKLKDGEYLKDPQVSIFVKEYNSKLVSVVGAVSKPGSYPMMPGMTVIQAISQAGGFSSLANRNSTTVTRRAKGELHRYHVAAGDVSKGTAEDFRLQPGDIVYVPERVF